MVMSMHRNLSVGTRISYGGDMIRAPSHGVILARHLDDEESVLYEVETWDGYVFGVYSYQITGVLS